MKALALVAAGAGDDSHGAWATKVTVLKMKAADVVRSIKPVAVQPLHFTLDGNIEPIELRPISENWQRFADIG